ncbi:MAG: TetR/AcrR family transcriptional regulator [Deltaproteobacteria bacterium]
MNRALKNPRTKISNAALGLFIKKGIKGTTTKEIAKKAGISEGTIYNYFRSKNDIAYHLFVQYMDMFRDKLADGARNGSLPEEKLSGMILSFFEFAEREPQAYAYIMMGHYTELEKMPFKKQKPKDLFVKVIAEGIREGKFRKAGKDLMAAHIIGMITRTILFHKKGILNPPYEQLIEETKKSALRVLFK